MLPVNRGFWSGLAASPSRWSRISADTPPWTWPGGPHRRPGSNCAQTRPDSSPGHQRRCQCVSDTDDRITQLETLAFRGHPHAEGTVDLPLTQPDDCGVDFPFRRRDGVGIGPVRMAASTRGNEPIPSAVRRCLVTGDILGRPVLGGELQHPASNLS